MADADNGRRLDCYDRETARLIMPPDRTAGGLAAAVPAVPNVIRACLANADTGQRLDCYDREVRTPDHAARSPRRGPGSLGAHDHCTTRCRCRHHRRNRNGGQRSGGCAGPLPLRPLLRRPLARRPRQHTSRPR